MERESSNDASLDYLISTEGQEITNSTEVSKDWTPPRTFTDLDDRTYHYGGRLFSRFDSKDISHLYFIPEPSDPNMSRTQKIFREQYLKDALEVQAKEQNKKES